jgi:environmental stress-induced protein Ves
MRTVPADGGQIVPWRNGRGTARELARFPDDVWEWRLSVATSDGPAPFSSFPGVDRELLLLHGTALELRFAAGPTVRLQPGESHRFAGEADVVGVPVGGPTEQLNLMWRRDRVRAELVHDDHRADVEVVGLALSLGVSVGVRLMPNTP